MKIEQRWNRGDSLDPEFVGIERAIRNELLASNYTRWAGAGGYQITENLASNPERIFIFRHGGIWYAGCKTISDYVLQDDMPGVFCSKVYWHNVIGSVSGMRISDVDARISFEPMDESARRTVFNELESMTELIHPFTKQSRRGSEKTSPPDGWLVTEQRARYLGLGESHIRRYTSDCFREKFTHLAGDVLAYDPACSTGQFLAEFALLDQARIRTVGQDLSMQMVDFATAHLGQVHHGDALYPAVVPGSVDILFCRFLNSEVVSTHSARQILPKLVATLRQGGFFVMFGHSPVLLDASDLMAAGLSISQTMARSEDYIFQYYVCRFGG